MRKGEQLGGAQPQSLDGKVAEMLVEPRGLRPQEARERLIAAAARTPSHSPIFG